MKRFGLIAAAALLSFALTPLAVAGGRGGGSGGGHSSGSSGHSSGHSASSLGAAGRTVHVNGYTKKDGTYVAGYDRAAPGTKSSLSLTNVGPSDSKPSTNDGIDIHWSREATPHLKGGFGANSRRSSVAQRDPHGRIERSKKAKDEFERMHPCPANGRTSGPCPGYVIDHIVALKRGGADDASNMQWQTVADAKAKDKWE
jgi:hypothetical protein